MIILSFILYNQKDLQNNRQYHTFIRYIDRRTKGDDSMKMLNNIKNNLFKKKKYSDNKNNYHNRREDWDYRDIVLSKIYGYDLDNL